MLTLVANSSRPSETGVFPRQDTLSRPDSGLSAADRNSPPVSLLDLGHFPRRARGLARRPDPVGSVDGRIAPPGHPAAAGRLAVPAPRPEDFPRRYLFGSPTREDARVM